MGNGGLSRLHLNELLGGNEASLVIGHFWLRFSAGLKKFSTALVCLLQTSGSSPLRTALESMFYLNVCFKIKLFS